MASTGTAIEVTPKVGFLQWILYLVKPKVSVDGNTQTGSWGKPTRFDVTPGSHTVEAWFRYLLMGQAGRNSLQVNVPEGQTVRVRYRSPWLLFLKGPLKVES